MVKRSIGITFIAISTIAILVKSLSEAFGGALLVGDTIINLSLVCFLAGLCYLSWGEYDKYKDGKRISGK
ncbi:hypothetical protein [Bacillus sp. JJ1562]|uniref:hypothetical protein n=1 Tax=Bacillus sp. JJ1562 TaxID=3122960 RepID=UPI00300387F5